MILEGWQAGGQGLRFCKDYVNPPGCRTMALQALTSKRILRAPHYFSCYAACAIFNSGKLDRTRSHVPYKEK